MQMVTKIFGEMLHCPETDNVTQFPSPASLKNKIVLSTKPPKEYPQSDNVIINPVSIESESSEEEPWGQELQDSMAQLKIEERVRETNTSDDDDDEEKEEINTSGEISNQQQQQGTRQYKHLITIHGGKCKGSMKDQLKVDDSGKVIRLSLDEKKLKSACESHGADLIRLVPIKLTIGVYISMSVLCSVSVFVSMIHAFLWFLGSRRKIS